MTDLSEPVRIVTIVSPIGTDVCEICGGRDYTLVRVGHMKLATIENTDAIIACAQCIYDGLLLMRKGCPEPRDQEDEA